MISLHPTSCVTPSFLNDKYWRTYRKPFEKIPILPKRGTLETTSLGVLLSVERHEEKTVNCGVGAVFLTRSVGERHHASPALFGAMSARRTIPPEWSALLAGYVSFCRLAR